MPVDLQGLASASLITAASTTSAQDRAKPSPWTAVGFQQGIQHLVNGVTVVTSADDGAWYGITTTSVCTLSADPPTLIACVRRQSKMGQQLGRTRRFCVNLLSREQRPVAEAFADSHIDGFQHGHWACGASGCPVLEDALASLECGIDLMYSYSSNFVIIGSVLQVRQSADPVAPLVRVAGQFCHAIPTMP